MKMTIPKKMILAYIEKLEIDSFLGWSDSEKKAYLTACISIKEYIKGISYSLEKPRGN